MTTENLAPSLESLIPESLRSFQGPAVVQEGAIQKVRYSHDAMIDLIIQNPWISQNELAKHFGYTQGWVSQVIAADAFQARLAERKNELVDPAIKATIEERFKALVVQSLEVLKRKLEAPLSTISDELALGSVNAAAKALGYGAKVPQVQVNTQFVVQVPGKAQSASEWALAHNPVLAQQSRVLEAASVAPSEGLVANAEEGPSLVAVEITAPSAPVAPDSCKELPGG